MILLLSGWSVRVCLTWLCRGRFLRANVTLKLFSSLNAAHHSFALDRITAG